MTRYIATIPGMPKYLEQYWQHHAGTLQDGETINLKELSSAANMLKRNLIPFKEEDDARRRWPEQFGSGEHMPKVGLNGMKFRQVRDDEGDVRFWALGPSGSCEILGILKGYFDMNLINDWAQSCAEYAKTLSYPQKKAFIDSFMERHGISCDVTQYEAIQKRMKRIMAIADTASLQIVAENE